MTTRATPIIAAVRCNLPRVIFRLDDMEAVSRYKAQLVSGLLLGLDLLVASDVIKTAALATTLYNVGTLGLLVMVRIALTCFARSPTGSPYSVYRRSSVASSCATGDFWPS